MMSLFRILVLTAGLISLNAQAQFAEMAVIGGFQTTEVDSRIITLDGGTGMYAGVMGYIDLGNGGAFRSGALLNERQWEADALGLEFKTLNLDIPLTYMHKFNDKIGVFGGARVGLNISDDCSGSSSCDADPETLYYAAEVGGHFRFAPDFGVEAAYNVGLSDIASIVADKVEWKNSLTIGVLYIY